MGWEYVRHKLQPAYLSGSFLMLIGFGVSTLALKEEKTDVVARPV